MSAPRKSYRKGDPARNFAADDYNAIAAEVEKWSALKAIAPLAIGDGPGGRYLTRDGDPSFYAKLSGASSPYSWTEQVETASGVWANGERTGTDAYEVNSRASLNNKVARLYPTAFDHRFRFITGGGTSGPVPPPCGCGAVIPPTTFHLAPALTTTPPNFGNAFEACYNSRFNPWVSGLTCVWGPLPGGTFPTSISTAPRVAATGYVHLSTTTVGGYKFCVYPYDVSGCWWLLARWAPSSGANDILYYWHAAGTGSPTATCSPWFYQSGISTCTGAQTGQLITVTMT